MCFTNKWHGSDLDAEISESFTDKGRGFSFGCISEITNKGSGQVEAVGRKTERERETTTPARDPKRKGPGLWKLPSVNTIMLDLLILSQI